MQGPISDAEDVFQEVLARACEHLDRLPDDNAIRTWLAQLTRRLAIDHLRAAAREQADEQALATLDLQAGTELDRPQRSRFSLAEMDLLELFAQQAATALHLLLQPRRTRAVLSSAADELVAVSHLAATVDSLEGDRCEAALHMISELDTVLRPEGRRS